MRLFAGLGFGCGTEASCARLAGGDDGSAGKKMLLVEDLAASSQSVVRAARRRMGRNAQLRREAEQGLSGWGATNSSVGSGRG